MKKPEIIEKLKSMGVEVDESMTQKELFALLKEKESEAGESDETEVDEEEADEKDEDDSEEESKSTGKSISFKIKNPNVKEGFSVRTFSEGTHGKDFAKLAKDFEVANTHQRQIQLAADKSNIAEVNAVVTFNSNIKHQILGKKSE